MEFDVDFFLNPPDALTYEEFSARHEVVTALIAEAQQAGDGDRLDIYRESLNSLELENHRAAMRHRKIAALAGQCTEI